MIKRVGGPEAAMKMVGVAGVLSFVAGGAAMAGVLRVTPVVKQKAEQLLEKWGSRGNMDELAGNVYKVSSSHEDAQGIIFEVGEVFRVLQRDGDAVLIEMVGHGDNPWFVSAQFLARISDFPSDIPNTDVDATDSDS
ncbi:hypothetical protein [Citricoccus sp. NR2]|uniref:hypothetical protein n=1 Tax=Citricoccus sp. NR2 TaxID=3004095 RepID=UPI0022DD32CD|nr:hypothetical protein [Citricoccus sp. NR2]WBL18775.1 hypothetical protein O1A05_13615 [Citricoccus sp. NR2]